MTIVFWFPFLHYYTTFTGMIAYLFVFRFKIKKISRAELFAITTLVMLFNCQLIGGKPFVASIIDFRFYWGWFAFYLFFKKFSISQQYIANALVVLCLITILETILINTVISPTLMPNFPDAIAGKTEYGRLYQRPYSFGASATVGSCLLVVLVALTKVRGWRLYLAVVTILAFMSGTGIFTLLLLSVIRYLKLIAKIILPVTVVFFAIQIIYPNEIGFIVNELKNKVGFEYVQTIFWLKLDAVKEGFLALDAYQIVVGDSNGGRGGDFGILLFLLANGVVGGIVLFMFVICHLNKTNALPLFLILLASFHYPVMFFIPGQFLFALLLNWNKNNELKYSYTTRLCSPTR